MRKLQEKDELEQAQKEENRKSVDHITELEEQRVLLQQELETLKRVTASMTHEKENADRENADSELNPVRMAISRADRLVSTASRRATCKRKFR